MKKDTIYRADAIEALDEDVMGGLNYERILQLLPSAEANSEDLIIKGAKGIQDGLYNIKDGKLFKYKANGGTVRTYPIVPSAEAVQGEWIEKYNGNGWNDFWDYTCSNCGKKYERANAVLYHANYCPNCGAKMKGGDSK